MKRGFYRRLAWTGIRKNKKLYTPYLLTCIGMVMMFYIVSFLNGSEVLMNISGGRTMQSMLGFGCGVIGVFALIFLFYTNSFLIRRRKKEFGLYNILGMGKRHLARVLLWESVMIAVISLGGGLLMGIALSKFSELGMVNILHSESTFSLSVNLKSIWMTLILFAVVFVLILLNTLRQIHLSNSIELLHSENVGEKPPKANWIFALAGAVILVAAYYLAVTIEDPISAMLWFFIAVIMVIVATYMLFMSGSVAICRILQKKKNYYYKTNHFVSVSSMVYRMKRNGAGLASICILCTMVLVTVSSTVCLYTGIEDSVRTRYPRDFNLQTRITSLTDLEGEKMQTVKETCAGVLVQYGQSAENLMDYRTAALGGLLEADSGRMRVDGVEYNLYQVSGDAWQIFLVPLEDYNRMMGENETLEPGEALIYTTKIGRYDEESLSLGDYVTFHIKKTLDDFPYNGMDTMQMIPAMYLIVPDFESVAAPLVEGNSTWESVAQLYWYYGFDLSCDDETQIQLQNELSSQIRELSLSTDEEVFSTLLEGAAKGRENFYGLYGGLLFLGIMLGAVFLFAAVLIMYYKQVSEGYEDQARFDIMQKVGMTKREIKKSVNSQILTVFFLPLLTAGVHLAFAFPMISKMMVLFSLSNRDLLIWVTICCYIVFALFYILVYRITSKAYYAIVSDVRERENKL